MTQNHYLLKGTVTLTAAGILSRIAGFFYKIFLSRAIGAEEIGLFHLCMPVYAFCMAAASGGIQTALSRFTAEYTAKNDRKSAARILWCALAASLTIALFFGALLYLQADWIAGRFLAEPRCALLLQILSVSLPFCALHACISGYFIGLKQIKIPAFSQVAEQFIRIGSFFFFCFLFLKYDKKMNASLMALGQIAGETASSLYCVLFLTNGSYRNVPGSGSASERTSHRFPEKASFSADLMQKLRSLFSGIRLVLTVSSPLSMNRMLLCVLHAIEAALLPQQLRLFGLSSEEALSAYGTLSGMALPLLMFPTAVTGALGTLLLPLVSEARALDQEKRIADTTKATVDGSLLLGFFFFSAFLLFGRQLGMLLFASERAGDYVRLLSLSCPFLYLNATLTSILHGLGKTTAASIQNTIGFLLRLASVLLSVPVHGMQGYFAGILLSHVFVTFFALLTLIRNSDYRPTVTDAFLKPAFLSLLTISALSLLRSFVPFLRMPGWSAFLLSLLLYLMIFTSLTICVCVRNRCSVRNRQS